MPRTTDLAVQGVMEGNFDAAIPLAPFIEAANHLVNKHCAPFTTDEVEMELVERWLSAHFYLINDPRTIQEATGPISATYQTRVDLGLKNTHYGQQALVLDSTGGLAKWDKAITQGRARAKVGLTWGGTDNPPVPPYPYDS